MGLWAPMPGAIPPLSRRLRHGLRPPTRPRDPSSAATATNHRHEQRARRASVNDRTVSETVVVAAPASVIFAILADARQHHRIDGSGSVQAIAAAPPALTRGASFSVRMRLFG